MSRTGAQDVIRTAGRRAQRSERDQYMPRPAWQRALILLGKVCAVGAFALAVIAGLLYVRLLHGPLAVSFLKGPIERAIAHEAAGMRVHIENAVVRLAEGGQVGLELTNVRVADADDVTLALAPSASLSLSRRALLAGRVAPESVELNSPRLLLFYNEDGNLSLKFSHPGDGTETETGRAPAPRSQPTPAAAPSRASASLDGGAGGLARIDLVKMLSEASARARRREDASAYLREIGLRSATVVIDNGTRKSLWRVPELNIDLDHRRSRSSIAGRIKVESLTGPWTLNFRTFERESADSMELAVSLQGLVPRGLARSMPQLAFLEGVDVPVWGDAKLELSNTGEILKGTIGIDAAPGHIRLPSVMAAPFRIDGGHIALAYDSAQRRFDVNPSVLVWGDSRLQLTGSVTHVQRAPDGPGWSFELKSAGGWLGAEPPELQRLAIDDWRARGHFVPEQGRVTLSQFFVRAGGTEISAQGEVADMAGATRARFDGRIGAMPVSVFKSLWPADVAPKSREWVARRLTRGTVQGGSFRVVAGDGVRAARGEAERSALTLEGANLAFAIVDGWPALEAPRGLLRLDEQNLEISLPDGSMATADGRRLAVKGSFSVDMREPLPRTGQVAVKAQGPLPAALALLAGEPFHALDGTGMNLAQAEGKFDSQATLSFPLGRALDPRDLKIEGKAHISDGRMPKVIGVHDLTGANITIDMTGSAVEARGDMLLNGVLAKARWQHVFGTPADKQPPARLTASLDNSDRVQLGLDINDFVQGEMGLEVTLGRGEGSERQVHVRADLTNADVLIDSIAWRKPKGRPGAFEFDVAKGTGAYPTELHDVKMVGETIAAQGWMGLGADHKVREYRFPSFSLNTVSSLSLQGKMRGDGIWDVTAKGTTYDGRDMFRSFFDVAHLPDRSVKPRPGIDLKAEMDTVIGFSDTALRGVKMTLQKRANRLTGLDVRGMHDGSKPKAFAAVLRQEPGKQRRLQAESQDAGATFKLVGFYPNAVGGQMNLEVNLDGQGDAERIGTLWARDFVVLGDPIVSEVLQNADGSQQAGPRPQVVRERFDFEVMRAPFAVGHGQFVISNAVINGPIVSASLRGKVDFRQRTLDVGGTYVPMSGLMRAPAPIPVLGPLLTGPRGEGMFGITFAIQGSMARPQVNVNPLSIITPGIFREIFQMTPEDPRVQPRDRPPSRGDASRASSAPAASSPAAPGGAQRAPEVGGSWSAETSGQPTRKK